MPDVTIVIPTYNRPKEIEKTLDSIASMDTEKKYETIIVDDSKDRKTMDLCERHNLEINYIRPENSKNTAHAKNIGWKSANSDIVAFVDDDIRPKDYWIDELISTFKDESVGAAGGPALETDNILNTAINRNKITKSGSIMEESDRWVPPNIVEVDTLRGANQAYRKSVLKEVQGFDEDYIGNCFREETDLCVRVKDADYRILYNPGATVRHISSENGGTRDKSKEFWYSLGYNQRRFVEKNFPEYRKYHLARFLFTWNYDSYGVVKILLSALKNLEPERIQYIRGFFNR